MKYTEEHTLAKPENFDDVVESINRYSQNFEKIDSLIHKTVPNLNLQLKMGKTYSRGKIFYNGVPTIGGYAGWINAREGTHAPSWVKNTLYAVNDLVITNPNNGYCYKCITNGTSSPIQPTFPIIVGATVDDTYGMLSWSPSKPYTLGEICKKTTGGQTFYYRCITAGTSNSVEPNWTDTEGTILVDGSVSWLVCRKAVWQNIGHSSEFRPFGKIE